MIDYPKTKDLSKETITEMIRELKRILCCYRSKLICIRKEEGWVSDTQKGFEKWLEIELKCYTNPLPTSSSRWGGKGRYGE